MCFMGSFLKNTTLVDILPTSHKTSLYFNHTRSLKTNYGESGTANEGSVISSNKGDTAKRVSCSRWPARAVKVKLHARTTIFRCWFRNKCLILRIYSNQNWMELSSFLPSVFLRTARPAISGLKATLRMETSYKVPNINKHPFRQNLEPQLGYSRIWWEKKHEWYIGSVQICDSTIPQLYKQHLISSPIMSGPFGLGIRIMFTERELVLIDGSSCIVHFSHTYIESDTDSILDLIAKLTYQNQSQN